MSSAENTSSGSSGRVKQTRRRQRLSCVECTRRRQKCDRQVPCGSCVSRGISDACRWEPIVARPDPQRPPESAPQHSTISALSARIAVLEQALSRQNMNTGLSEAVSSDERILRLPLRDESGATDSTGETDGNSDTSVPPAVPVEEDGDCALARFDADVQLAAASMAQLSLAPSNEYIGSGTLWCALHKLGDPDNYLFPVSRSLGSTTVENQVGNSSLVNAIQQLVSSLPSPSTTELLVSAYFSERDWQFGIPEGWFKTNCQQMWQHLDLPCTCDDDTVSTGTFCQRCTHHLNPHWLTLLFAVLALSPAPHELVGDNARVYFWKSIEARRLVEDIHLSFAAYASASTQHIAHGAALGCIAAALLATYLADRGRISDAWKLTGNALRSAQAVGLHRDPGWMKWERMDRQESELRLLGWWFLVVSDRVYSLILGRPTMASQGTYDVKLVPGALHGDGSPNACEHFQKFIFGLMQIIDEAVTKCFGPFAPTYATVTDIDRKFVSWHSRLHPSLDWRKPHEPTKSPTAEERRMVYQRHMSAAYYLGGIMNLHRLYLMHPPPILPQSKGAASSSTTHGVLANPSRERCINLAMELVRVLCDGYAEAEQWSGGDAHLSIQIPHTAFHYAYFVFDGAVALVGALSQDPPHPMARGCLELIRRATATLAAIRDANTHTHTHMEGEHRAGDTASRGIAILTALRKAGRWDERLGRSRSTADKSHATGQGSTDSGGSAQNTPVSVQSSREGGPSSSVSVAGDFHSPIQAVSSPSVNLPGLTYDQTHTPTSVPSLDPPQPWFSLVSSMPFATPQPSSGTPSYSVDYPDLPQSLPTYLGDNSVHNLVGMDFTGLEPYSRMQTGMLPFDMLQNSDNDIDWAVVINSASGKFASMGPGAWTGGGGLFGNERLP